MKSIALIVLLLSAYLGYGQRPDTVFVRYTADYTPQDQPIYTVDTIIFASPSSRQFLIGTSVLRNTNDMFTAYDRGLYLYKVEETPCSGGDEYGGEGEDTITDIRVTDSTLEVEILFHSNCCMNFLCTAGVDSANVLHLNILEHGSLCACGCCFGLTFVFSRDEPYEEVPPVESVMIQNALHTKKAILLE